MNGIVTFLYIYLDYVKIWGAIVTLLIKPPPNVVSSPLCMVFAVQYLHTILKLECFK